MAASKHPQFSVRNAYLVEGVEQRGIVGGVFQPTSYGPAAQYMEPIQADLNSSGRFHLKDAFEGGKYRFGDGTLTAPAIAFALDADLGFFRSASNQMAATGKLLTTSTATLPGLLVGSYAGEPSTLVNGDIWYNSTVSKYRLYENAVARDLLPNVAYKSADQSVTNSTTLVDDNHLTVTIAPTANDNGFYSVRIFGRWDSAGGGNPGIRVAATGTAGLSYRLKAYIYNDASLAIAGMGDIDAADTPILSGAIAAGSFIIEGTVKATSSGTFLFRWANDNAAIGVSTRVRSGSYMELKKIN